MILDFFKDHAGCCVEKRGQGEEEEKKDEWRW